MSNDINASVVVSDKVDSKIETKITNIGIASENATIKLNALQKTLNGLGRGNAISSLRVSIQSLASVNLSTLHNQLNSISSVGSKVSQSFNATSISAAKLQIAQTKLAQEQTKLAILNQRLETLSVRTATAQTRQAIATQNLANATARSATSATRSAIAQEQLRSSVFRTAIAQERLHKIMTQQPQSITRTQTSVLGLVGVMSQLSAIGFTGLGLAKAGDEYQRLINKLMLVSDSAGHARERLATLTDVAIGSYSSLDSVTQLYVRMDLALKQMGGSATEAVVVTQTLSKAVHLAGLTTAEANSALLQISQAFNKGKLDGDEFRTVMETMPILTDAIARKLNTTRGELLKLAPEGKITGRIMKEAVLEMAEVVDQRFARLTPTVSMQLQNLATQAQTYFGSMFKDTGSAQMLANSISAIANNLDTATRMATVFGIAFASVMAISKITAMVGWVRQLNTALRGTHTILEGLKLAIARSPFSLFVTIATGIGLAIDLIYSKVEGQSLFPSYDQDKAKADDYLRRLKDINGQMDLMSYTKLKSVSAENEITFGRLNKSLAESQSKLAKLNKEIEKETELQKRLKVAQDELDQARNSGSFNQIDEKMSAWADIKRQTVALDELKNKELERLELQEQIKQIENDKIDLMKSERYALQEMIERINNAKKSLEGKTQAEIDSNEELRAQQRIVNESDGVYAKLISRVRELEESLRSILGIGADLTPAINNIGQSVINNIDTSALNTISKLQQQIDFKNRLNNAKTAKERADINAEQKLASEKDRLSNVDISGRILQDHERGKTQTAYDTLKAEFSKMLLDSENTKSGKGKTSKELSIREKMDQKLKMYIANLKEEHLLLSQGVGEYNKYAQLHKLRNEFAVKGLQMKAEEFTELKKQIDINTKLKDIAKEIYDMEQRSAKNQREKWQSKFQALQEFEGNPLDKKRELDSVVGSMGAISNVNQGLAEIQQNYETFYQRLSELREQNFMSEVEYETAISSLKNQNENAIYEQRLKNMQDMGGMYGVMATAFTTFEQNATQSIMGVLTRTTSLKDAFLNLADTILTSVVQAIIQMGVRWIAQQAMQMAFGQSMLATTTATQVATATTLATAWSPVATLVSLATFGTNSAPAMAGMTTAMAFGKSLAIVGGRRTGGSVRAGDLYQVGEGNAPEIFRSNSGNQYMISGDSGRVFSNKDVMGNITNNSPTQISVNIENYGVDKSFDVQQVDNETIRIVVNDVLKSEGNKFVETYMKSDNGQEIISNTAKRNS